MHMVFVWSGLFAFSSRAMYENKTKAKAQTLQRPAFV